MKNSDLPLPNHDQVVCTSSIKIKWIMLYHVLEKYNKNNKQLIWQNELWQLFESHWITIRNIKGHIFYIGNAQLSNHYKGDRLGCAFF